MSVAKNESQRTVISLENWHANLTDATLIPVKEPVEYNFIPIVGYGMKRTLCWVTVQYSWNQPLALRLLF